VVILLMLSVLPGLAWCHVLPPVSTPRCRESGFASSIGPSGLTPVPGVAEDG
jgi:hypothetical protein